MKYARFNYLLPIVFISNVAIAKDEATQKQSKNLGRTIITATKTPTTLDDAPGSVTVLQKEELNQKPNAKLSDTLRGMEGLRQVKSRGLSTLDSITVRGLPNGAMIMLDGIPLNDLDNNTKMLVAMSPEDIDQAEVVRGPFSNLYGSGALSGAINFVTKMPTGFEARGSIGYGSPFVPNAAPENLVRGYLSYGDALLQKRLKLKLSYGFTTSSGYAADSAWVNKNDNILNNNSGSIPSQNLQGKPIAIVGDMGKQAFQTHDLKLRASYEVMENLEIDSSFAFNYYDYTHNDPKTFLRDPQGRPVWGSNTNVCNGAGAGAGACNRPLPLYFVRGAGKERYAQSIFHIGYKQFFGEISLQAKYARIDGWRDFNNPDGGASSRNSTTTQLGGPGTHNKYRYQANNLDLFTTIPLEALVPILAGQNLLAGFQLRHLSADSVATNISNWTDFSSPVVSEKNRQGGQSLSTGIFVELRSEWLRNLSTTLGLRYDFWLGYNPYKTGLSIKTTSKHQVSPKATLNYRYLEGGEVAGLEAGVFKFSIGQGFRAPTPAQLFTNYKTGIGLTALGNPSLKPEVATSFDFGAEQRFSFYGMQSLLKAYYFNTFMLDIIYMHIDMPNLTATYKNGSTALINGLELSYKQSLPYNLSLLLTYTYTNSEMLKNPSDKKIEGKKLTGIPEHLGYVQLGYDDGAFFGSFGIEMMSKPYALADNSDTIGGVYSATDGYVLGDVKAGYRFLKHYEVSASITNIFNQKYFSYYKAPGAAFYLQFGGSFGS